MVDELSRADARVPDYEQIEFLCSLRNLAFSVYKDAVNHPGSKRWGPGRPFWGTKGYENMEIRLSPIVPGLVRDDERWWCVGRTKYSSRTQARRSRARSRRARSSPSS